MVRWCERGRGTDSVLSQDSHLFLALMEISLLVNSQTEQDESRAQNIKYLDTSTVYVLFDRGE